MNILHKKIEDDKQTSNIQSTPERDAMILNQLYNGNHLEPQELERARKLLYLMNVELKNRR